MMDERLQYLYKQYQDKRLTAAEESEWRTILADPAMENSLLELIGTAWDHPDAAELKMDREQALQTYNYIIAQPRHSSPVRRMWVRGAAAAAVLIMLLSAVWIFQVDSTSGPGEKLSEMQDIGPGGNHATLTFADGRKIELNKVQHGIVMGDHIAYTDGSKAVDLSEVTGDFVLSTPQGGQYQVLLQDGTKVWLNSASSLTFPKKFTGDSRRVQMTGECYFEVAHNRSKSFLVDISNQMEVKVLGTRFNVAAYPEEHAVAATLLEGSVQVNSLLERNRGERKMLKPGQQVQLETWGNNVGSMHIKDLERPETKVAWKEGLFSFSNADITEIMLQLSRWYDLEVEYSGPKPEVRITGQVPRSLNLGDLIELLKLSNIKMEIENKKVIISN